MWHLRRPRPGGLPPPPRQRNIPHRLLRLMILNLLRPNHRPIPQPSRQTIHQRTHRLVIRPPPGLEQIPLPRPQPRNLRRRHPQTGRPRRNIHPLHAGIQQPPQMLRIPARPRQPHPRRDRGLPLEIDNQKQAPGRHAPSPQLLAQHRDRLLQRRRHRLPPVRRPERHPRRIHPRPPPRAHPFRNLAQHLTQTQHQPLAESRRKRRPRQHQQIADLPNPDRVQRLDRPGLQPQHRHRQPHQPRHRLPRRRNLHRLRRRVRQRPRRPHRLRNRRPRPNPPPRQTRHRLPRDIRFPPKHPRTTAHVQQQRVRPHALHHRTETLRPQRQMLQRRRIPTRLVRQHHGLRQQRPSIRQWHPDPHPAPQRPRTGMRHKNRRPNPPSQNKRPALGTITVSLGATGSLSASANTSPTARLHRPPRITPQPTGVPACRNLRQIGRQKRQVNTHHPLHHPVPT